MRNNYLVLWYKNISNADFICEYNGEARIKVTRVKEINRVPLTEGLYGVSDDGFFTFENISLKRLGREELLAAIEWFKKYTRQRLKIVDI